MAHLAKNNIPRSEMIPFVESDLFVDNEDKRFAIGVFSSEDVLNYEENNNSLVQGYLRLRANTYIDHSNILNERARRHDGTELDKYDKESVHFALFEQIPAINGFSAGVDIVGSSRLVIRHSIDDHLPLEKVFNNLDHQATVGGVEVSRFIINHGEKAYQQKLKSKLIMAQLAYVMSKDLGPVFGMVERRFKRNLEFFGIESETVADPVNVKEGGDINGEGARVTELLAVRISTDSIERKFGREAINRMSTELGGFSYWGQYSDDNKKVIDLNL